MFKALADPVRLRLLSLVASHAGGEACVCDLYEAFDLSQPTISHHLKVLHEAGLLDREKRGTWVYYWVQARCLSRLAVLIERGRRMSEPRLDERDVAARLSTLDRFLPVWIGARHGRRAAARPVVPGLDDALGAVEVDGDLAADRPRPAGDDVPGAGQGPLRPARHRHRRPAAAGRSLVLNWVSARPSCSPWPGCSCPTCRSTGPG